MPISRQQAMDALRTVQDPELFKDLVTLNMIKDVHIREGSVHVRVELTTPACPKKEKIRADIEAALKQVGADVVNVELTAKTLSPSGVASSPLPQVKNIVAVGAGKGGVGKSTIAVNLAVGLARAGASAGLMDGDIYGPSAPTLLGIKGRTPKLEGGKIIPFPVHGIHVVTIGSLVPEDKPLIWRGPMAHGAFKQLLLDNTIWPELDYLIVDLPPGTGDVPLTLCQLLPLTGAVIVATPQQVALDDAIRAVRMFQQLNAPILGMIENMSYFANPDGSSSDIFGRGGAELAAKKLRLPFLGALPLFTELRINSDAGEPTKNFTGDPRLRDALEQIVQTLAGRVSVQNSQPSGPELEVV